MDNLSDFGVKRFGRFNWLGLWTIVLRENQRFLNIWQQTVLAPLVTAGLFLTVFTIAIGKGRGDVMGLPFIVFLAPGLMMMTVIQNSFASASSSLLSSKVTGSIVDSLMPPLSPLELTIGYIAGGVGRAFCIGIVLMVAIGLVLGIWVQHPIWTILFIIGGGAFMGSVGVIAGIYAQKFDQMSAISNFVVTPLAFLSGTFYSISALPDVLVPIARINPMFYIIDGGRYGVTGVSDGSPWVAVVIVYAATLAVAAIAWRMFKTGYRIRP